MNDDDVPLTPPRGAGIRNGIESYSRKIGKKWSQHCEATNTAQLWTNGKTRISVRF